MRPTLLGAVFLFAMGCTQAPAGSSFPKPSPIDVQPAASEPPAVEPLPAGIYYRHHSYRPCGYLDEVANDDGICIAPTHAVIAGTHADPHSAERLARQADALGLAPGYPFVAHTDELGLANDAKGIVVVLGQFRSVADADVWRRELQPRVPSAVVVGLLGAEEAFAQLPQGQPTKMAARITSRTAVPAYASVVVTDPDTPPVVLPPDHSEDKGETDDSPQTQQACSLAPGAVILSDHEQLQFGFYRWAPVTCPDGTSAWVRWQHTSLGVSVRRAGDHHEVIRLMGAECDSPWFETSIFDDPTSQQIATTSRGGGCGGS